MQRQPGKLFVEVVRRLAQIVGAQRLVELDDFLDHMAAARHDDDEHAQPAERHELDAVEHRGFVRRPHREADASRRLRQHVRHLREQRIEQPIRALAAQPSLDRSCRPVGAFGVEQQIDVKAVAAIGRDASG